MRGAAHRLEIRRGTWLPSDERSKAMPDVELIVPSDCAEEYMHLDGAGRLVHRVSGDRSLLARLLGPISRVRALSGWFFAVRALEKAIELELLYGRHWSEVSAFDPRVRMLLPLVRLPTFARAEVDRRVGPHDDGVRSADLVCCTRDRVDALLETLPDLVREAKRARATGVPCRVIVVHQKVETPARVLERAPWLRRSVEFVSSDSPGVTRARNVGLSSSIADLVIFVDDDVLLAPGFVLEHLRAAERFPRAVGVAGRVKSRGEGDRIVHKRAVGQLRPTGDVDAGFDSGFDDLPLVPLTPRGANMSFRRRRVNALLGPAWFDESLDGTANREETTVALELFRRGAFLVYAPHASLRHVESPADGCEQHSVVDDAWLSRRLALDYLFLNRLYSHDGLLRALGPLGLLAREVLRG
ncbi:MAG: glycosyltransferase family A protein, partial [Myxococcaceae bacterium]